MRYNAILTLILGLIIILLMSCKTYRSYYGVKMKQTEKGINTKDQSKWRR